MSARSVTINGVQFSIGVSSPQDVVSVIAQSVMRKDLVCWSADALRSLYDGVLEFAVIVLNDMAGEMSKTAPMYKAYRQRIVQMKKLIQGQQDRQKIGKEYSVADMLQKIYNLPLSQENLGGLAGFGETNRWGDRPKGNPEYARIVGGIVI